MAQKRATRAEMARPKVDVFSQPSALDIPKGFKERMENAGYIVRWIRISVRGTDDLSGWNVRRREGWKLVSPQECPEWGDPPTLDHGKFQGIIAVNDLALGILPKEKAEAAKDLNEARAEAQATAVRNNLQRLSDKRMPIQDQSSSVVTGGRQVGFQN